MSLKKFMKNYSLLTLLISILVIIALASFTKTIFPHLSPYTIDAEAQTVAFPSPYCLGSCPTIVPSQNPTSAVTTPALSAAPTVPQTTTSPTTTQPSPSPSTTSTGQPCNVDQASIQHDKDKKKNKKHKKSRGGFLEALFRFIFQLILLLLQKGGLEIPNQPVPGEEPCAAVTPSISPLPSTGVSKTPTETVSETPTGVTPSTGNAQIPTHIINLTNWKLTLPIGAQESPTEIKQPQLATYTNNPWFIVSGGGVRFRSAVNGVTTSGSGYPRSELREMFNNGTTNASWSSSSGTHTMVIEEAITALPATKKHVVAGQIHDGTNDVIVIRLEDKKLFIDIGGSNGPILDANYTLGKHFTVKFEATGGKTNIYYNNNTTPAYTLTRSYSGAFFKAGAYTQSNCSKEASTLCNANNYGEVIIYRLEVTHQ